MLQVDRKEIVEAPVEKVNQFLSQVLADLGWQNVNTEGGVTTGEMIDSDFSHSQNHFTVIITCVSLSEKTELLLRSADQMMAIFLLLPSSERFTTNSSSSALSDDYETNVPH